MDGDGSAHAVLRGAQVSEPRLSSGTRLLLAAVGAVTALASACVGTRPVAPSAGCEQVLQWKVSAQYFPSWDPAGRRVAVMSSRDDHGSFAPGLYSVDVVTGSAEKLEDFSNMGYYGGQYIGWSPDGNRLLMWMNGGIYIFDLRDRSWTAVPNTGEFPDTPQWSPGGDSVFFLREFRLSVADLRSGAVTVFAYDDTGRVHPEDRVSFSPDGRTLAYSEIVPDSTGRLGLGYEIFIVGLDRRGRRQVTTLGGAARNPIWVSDNEIVFDFVTSDCLTVRDPVHHTWSVHADGTNAHRWTYDLGDSFVQFGFPPAMDRAHRRVAMIKLDPATNKGGLFTMGLDGRDLRRVWRQ